MAEPPKKPAAPARRPVPGATREPERADRLARALRDNLRKRKAQDRERTDPGTGRDGSDDDTR